MGLFSRNKAEPDIIVTIPQMSCGHCEGRITNLLQQVEGVKKVTADASTKEAKVFGTASFEELAKALEGTGYIPSKKGS